MIIDRATTVKVHVCDMCGNDMSAWDDQTDLCNTCAAKNVCLEDGHSWALVDVAVSEFFRTDVYGTCEVCYAKMLFRVEPVAAEPND